MTVRAITGRIIRCGVALAVVLAVLSLTGSHSFATEPLMRTVPGAGSYSCGLCHLSVPTQLEPPEYNVFGDQAKANLITTESGESAVDWQTICPLDADGDGYTNGRELDDPDCLYPDEMSNSVSSHPALTDSVPRDTGDDAGGDAGEDASSDATDVGENAADSGESDEDSNSGNDSEGCSTASDGSSSLPFWMLVLVVAGVLRVRRSRE